MRGMSSKGGLCNAPERCTLQNHAVMPKNQVVVFFFSFQRMTIYRSDDIIVPRKRHIMCKELVKRPRLNLAHMTNR